MPSRYWSGSPTRSRRHTVVGHKRLIMSTHQNPLLELPLLLFEGGQVESIHLWGSHASGHAAENSDYDLVCLMSENCLTGSAFESRIRTLLQKALREDTTDVPGCAYKARFFDAQVDVKFHVYETFLSYVISSKRDPAIDERLHTLLHSLGQGRVLVEKGTSGTVLHRRLQLPLSPVAAQSLIIAGLQFPPVVQLQRLEKTQEVLAATWHITRTLICIGKVFAGINSRYCYTRAKGLLSYFNTMPIHERVRNQISSICLGNTRSSQAVSSLLLQVAHEAECHLTDTRFQSLFSDARDLAALTGE
jgi:predicted nucleotidyltransferase